MSLRKQLLVALVFGISFGVAVPFATGWLSTLEGLRKPTYVAVTSAKQVPHPNYHFVLNNKILSVVEGNPGEKGKVILSGLDVKLWPVEFIDMAPKVVFYSLDEVQSYIDTVSETMLVE